MNANRIRIAELASLIRVAFRRTATDYLRSRKLVQSLRDDPHPGADGVRYLRDAQHGLRAYQEQIAEWERKVLHLYRLTMEELPNVSVRLRLIGDYQSILDTECLDFDALETELRTIEAATVQPSQVVESVEQLTEWSKRELSDTPAEMVRHVCEAGGRIRIQDLAALMGWTTRIRKETNWENNRKRANKQLNRVGWTVHKLRNSELVEVRKLTGE